MNKISKVNLLKLTLGKCFFCGCHLDALTCRIEHLIPKSRGGSNRLKNLAPACNRCNSKKADRTVAELRVKIIATMPVFSVVFYFETIGLSAEGELNG